MHAIRISGASKLTQGRIDFAMVTQLKRIKGFAAYLSTLPTHMHRLVSVYVSLILLHVII